MASFTFAPRALALCIVLGLWAGASAAGAAPGDKPGWQLTFQDELDGSALDTSKWKRRYKWGEGIVNGELQAYVDDAFLLQNGILSIVGKHEPGDYAGQTLEYRSGVICSIHEQTYGYFEARFKVPEGKGYWPAFWLLGAEGTPNVNEIDVMEILGDEPSTAYMTVHWGTSYDVGHESDGTSFSGPDFSADFHVFGLEWDPGFIKWSIDGVERFSHTGDGIPSVPMYIILNLAIGGAWPGAPDSTTVFPGSYEIDYVRAYQRSAADAGTGGSAGNAGSAGSAGASAGGTGTGGSAGGGPSGGGTPGASSDDSGCGCRVSDADDIELASAGALLAVLAWIVRKRLTLS